jgi:hypothetical protein
MTWTPDELNKIETADELELTSLRRDGSPRRPVTIWVVRVGDDLYVRAVNGRTSPWFRGTLSRHEGRVQSGGVEKDVAFVEEADPTTGERIDAAYREKYRRYPKSYVDACLTAKAQAATIKLVPRPTNG